MSKSLVMLDLHGATACCAPLTGGALSPEQAEQVAPLLKALADPVRLRLMSLIASRPGGEACVCDLTGAFELSQPTISHRAPRRWPASALSSAARPSKPRPRTALLPGTLSSVIVDNR